MDQTTRNYLDSFGRRANARLATLARELAGALAGGNDERVAALTEEGQLLTHGLGSCQNPNNQLTDAERLYIAGKLLPLTTDVPEETYSAVLTMNPLAARQRGQTEAAALVVSGRITGTVPPGAQLVISRDGVQVQRGLAQEGGYSFSDAAPGTRYRVEVTGTTLSQERVRPLISPVIFGTGPAGANAGYLAGLPAAPAAEPGKLRLSFTGQRNRILVCVPLSQGTVTAITQPDDNDADILMAFSRRRLNLDFGPDGADQYEVLENSRDFIGGFTADFQLSS